MVDVVEPMGSEIYLYMKAGSADLVVRVPAYVKAEPHQPMELVVNLERIHLFDRENGRTLLNGRPHTQAIPPPAVAAAS